MKRKIPILFPILIFITLMSSCATRSNQLVKFKQSKYYPDGISTEQYSENVISFTSNEALVFISRTTGWEYQAGHVFERQHSKFVLVESPELLDSIYNGAISPSGDKIIFCEKRNKQDVIFLLSKQNNKWTKLTNLSNGSGIYGGYFYWLNDREIYFYTPDNHGDIVCGILEGDSLIINYHLMELNTGSATEFSPFVDEDKQFMIFTRYLEGDVEQQGFFISFNRSKDQKTKWSVPQKIDFLPYGWSAYINKSEKLFLYSDGEDIMAMPLKEFEAQINKMRSANAD
ncbi:MAG: hypothetical protein AAF740_03015 [Bacteroidota bacterium]